MSILERRPTMASIDPQARFIIRQPVAVARGNSRASQCRVGRQFPMMPKRLGQVVERVNIAKLAGVNQAHEHGPIPFLKSSSAIHCPAKTLSTSA